MFYSSATQRLGLGDECDAGLWGRAAFHIQGATQSHTARQVGEMYGGQLDADRDYAW